MKVFDMNHNFETRIIIYSVILGMMFFIALIIAYRHRPGNKRQCINHKSL